MGINQTQRIQSTYKCNIFIKYRVATGDVELKHYSTTKMIADHFARPLQGGLFRIFRADLMNITEDADITDMVWDGTKTEKG